MINIILIIALFYFPLINVGYINITPDFLLLLIIVNVQHLNDYKALFLGLFIGLIQDFLTQDNYFGLIAIFSILISYFLLKIKSYKSIKFYELSIFLLILLYSFLKYTIMYDETYYFYLQFSLIQSIITYSVLFLIKTTFKERFGKFGKV